MLTKRLFNESYAYLPASKMNFLDLGTSNSLQGLTVIQAVLCTEDVL